MNQPKTIDPVEWARYNQAQQHRETRERVLGALKPAQFAGSRCGGKSQWVREQIERAQTTPEPRITHADCVELDERARAALDQETGCECPGAHECGVTTSTAANERRQAAECCDIPDEALADFAVEEMPGPVLDLTLAVHRAASELEGSSERGDRIALQLLTALARFERARHAEQEGL